MKLSYNWLCEHLSFTLAPEELAKHLVALGFEVADMRRLGPQFSGVVVGEVLAVQKHPNADRLSLCEVSDGTQKMAVVCGAKNVAAGQRVLLAKVGAKLPGGRAIERSNIRGVESNGMLCSAAELGLTEKNGGGTSPPPPSRDSKSDESRGDGIMVLPENSPLGQDATKLVGESDCVFELEITPNRADCLSHYGLARELSIHFQSPLKEPALWDGPGDCASGVSVEIKDSDACRRYIGTELKNLKIGPSPSWLAQRLQAAGLRPINNLVDITNYVMLELGHPLHAFDADKLEGNRIVVRFSDGEKFAALDGKTYELGKDELVIADAKKAVALAGVMGGAASGVTDKTTRAFLEAAHFKPSLVRRASSKLKLRSDSSYRFERGTDPNMALMAHRRAAKLIIDLCKATASKPADQYPSKVEPAQIELSTARINQILGTKYANDKVEGMLKTLSAKLTAKGQGQFSFFAPTYRLDLVHVWDVAEEVARHFGYDSIPSEAAPVRFQRPRANPMQAAIDHLREALKAQGFLEAYNYDFASKAQLARCNLTPEGAKAVAVANPLSEDWAYLRPTLMTGLLQSAQYNMSHGSRSLRLFEVGRSYAPDGADVTERTWCAGVLFGDYPARPHWRRKSSATDFYDAKGCLEALTQGVGEVVWTSEGGPGVFFHPKAFIDAKVSQGWLGRAGLLHPRILEAWELPEGACAFVLDIDLFGSIERAQAKLKPYSAFPPVSRDLSVVADESVPYAELSGCLGELENLVDVDLIDVYAGKGIAAGKRSLTLRLRFSRMDRTLTDTEVDAAIQDALKRLTKAGATLRS